MFNKTNFGNNKINLFAILLIIGLTVLSICLWIDNGKKSQALQQKYFTQESLDRSFIKYLSHAQSDFGADFIKIEELDNREKAYSLCMADLSAAVALSELTSYDKVNDNLDIALYSLLEGMKDREGKANQIMKDSKKLFYILKDILFAPTDKTKTKTLSEYISNIN